MHKKISHAVPALIATGFLLGNPEQDKRGFAGEFIPNQVTQVEETTPSKADIEQFCEEVNANRVKSTAPRTQNRFYEPAELESLLACPDVYDPSFDQIANRVRFEVSIDQIDNVMERKQREIVINTDYWGMFLDMSIRDRSERKLKAHMYMGDLPFKNGINPIDGALWRLRRNERFPTTYDEIDKVVTFYGVFESGTITKTPPELKIEAIEFRDGYSIVIGNRENNHQARLTKDGSE